jgi:inner membrane protein
MDSLTHIALGACMGEAFAGKELGRKALLWGALAQSIPDIDFVSSFWMDTTSALLAHRGFTHSILFCLLITPVMALVAERWHRPHNIRFARWLLFFTAVVFIHLFIDAFNNYGVGWYEPFSHERVSFNAIYVADPFFSIAPGIACLALLLLPRWHKKRKAYWRLGLGVSLLYLCLCIWHKFDVDRKVQLSLQLQKVPYTRYFSTPAPLQNFLWYIVAGNDSGFHVGFYSTFDRKKDIQFTFFPRQDTLLLPFQKHKDLHELIRFSKGFYTVENWKDTVVFNDLRFGQIIGWQNPKGRFVFYYYLTHPDANRLVVQRGRFEGWNESSITALIRRMGGE